MNELKTWTIVLNFLVLVGRGHGGATVGILGIFGFTQLITGSFIFTANGLYEYRLETVGLISLVGEIRLLVSYWISGKGRRILTFLPVSLCLAQHLFLFEVHNS